MLLLLFIDFRGPCKFRSFQCQNCYNYPVYHLETLLIFFSFFPGESCFAQVSARGLAGGMVSTETIENLTNHEDGVNASLILGAISQ